MSVGGGGSETKMGLGSILKARSEFRLPSIDTKDEEVHSMFTTTELRSLTRWARITSLCAAAVSLLLGRIGRWSGRDIDALQGERLGRSCLSVARFPLSLARSAQAECDNESCFFACSCTWNRSASSSAAAAGAGALSDNEAHLHIPHAAPAPPRRATRPIRPDKNRDRDCVERYRTAIVRRHYRRSHRYVRHGRT
ncbi:hypothetical protein EVAR_84701_1 [Eumeta japonica]|uniref:Uncharacterized protein n=1 Tax=Eumeta variegata TaxID=151549 RepID=A0A4C1VQF1_EUMVA|nr:hypothetical protein EVAR_84701_1 [Eumeta japonica]